MKQADSRVPPENVKTWMEIERLMKKTIELMSK
jgi:hypothetical protein